MLAEAGAGGRVLATKLHAPARRAGVVRRDRLIHRFDGPVRPALTLVSAPAGFGKTTLLAEWARADDRAIAWLSLDPGDDDPIRFWRHVVAALRATSTSARRPGLATSIGDGDGDDVVVLLVDELAALGREIVVVFDDYHVIESTEIHEALGYLIEHVPENVRFVIGSRADPPLPLARLRARGDLAEIRAADLRFTAAEAADYLNGSMGLGLTDVDIDRLGVRAEGWIAALQLAALSLQGRDDAREFIEAFSGDDRFVLDYLAEEVLDRQPADVRRFLLDTSLLGRLTGALCDAVTGTSGGRAMLQSLERANLFVVALDDHRRWYRYHHLFADVLHAHLLDERPDVVDDLHRRASDWHAEHGDGADAVEHALRGHDPDRAARLIELAAPAMRRSRQEATLRRWLEALPPDVFADRPVLSVSLVGARMATGDVDGVGPLLDRVEQLVDPHGTDAVVVFDDEEFRRLPAQTAVYRAGLALLGGDVDATIVHARRAQELSDVADHLRQGSAAALIGLAHWARGELGDAEERYTAAIDHLRAAGHISDVLGCSLALADIQIAHGRLHDARATYDSALHLATDHQVVRGTADMHVGIAMVLIEHDRLDEAARHLELADACGERAGLPQHAYRSRVAAAQLAAARGELDEARRLLADAAPRYDTDFSPSTHPVAARIARVDLLRGDLARARRWAREAGVDRDESPSYVREFELATLARTLVAAHHVERDQRALDDAIALLGRLRAAAEAGDRVGGLIEIVVVLATAHQGAGDRTAAADELERALALAAPDDHVRVFLDVTPSLAPLLRSMPLDDVAGRHRDRVVAGIGGTGAPSPSAKPLVVDLSSREREVLRLLRSDLSGPEIARELHVSLNTLRTHTKSIYTKLGATNRRAAVRIAADHGL